MFNKQRPANSRFANKQVQYLNQASCFVSSSVQADSFVPRIKNPRSETRPNAKPENVTCKRADRLQN